MSVGLLTGRPAEEMPGSTGDLLLELLQLHERVRQAMQGVVHAMWPSLSMPEGLGGAYKEAGGSVAALPFVEDIGLPSRCQEGLGHGEDLVHEG